MKLKPIVHAILSAYPLPIHGDHGGGHWARVLENGIRLSSTTKANIAVISLFAVFHDSCQQNECGDPELGLRGAEVAKKVIARLFDLSNDEFQLLYIPCENTHVNALILASRFRPVGTLIDSIWGGSVLRRIQVGLVRLRLNGRHRFWYTVSNAWPGRSFLGSPGKSRGIQRAQQFPSVI